MAASSCSPFRSNSLKFHLLIFSLLVVSVSIFIFTSTFDFEFESVKPSSNQSVIFDLLSEDLKGKKIKIGLVNMHGEEEWKTRGTTTLVTLPQIPENRGWDDYFPEWIDEDEKWETPKCPDIPMPASFENYYDLDIVAAKVPCGDHSVKGKGMRDVFRLQVNLVVAHLVVYNRDGKNLFVVFMGSCEPMMELFRCDDLVRHEDQFWIYKPDLGRLKQKILMPFGSCQLAVPPTNQGEKEIRYDLSKLSNPIDHPKVAYVTMLHSSEAYVCGALALAQSIIQTNSTKDLVLLADHTITRKSRRALGAAGWKVRTIQRIRSPYAQKDAYNEWNYSKLRIWQLTEYHKIIFIDSDLILLKNIDNFFLYPQLSAAGNDKHLFNSGIMLVEPSNCVFEMLNQKMYTLLSYNGGDQGFINEAFTWWHRLPTRLNFLKMFEGVEDDKHDLPESVYAIHYLGLKPWMCYRDYDCNWDMLDHHPFASDSAHSRWWQVYDAMPKTLQPFCGLTRKMDARINKWRGRAANASLPDRHYMIKVKDPRQRKHLAQVRGGCTQ